MTLGPPPSPRLVPRRHITPSPGPAPSSTPTSTSSQSIPHWISQQYYRHGLFCATHPRLVLLMTALGLIYVTWPLIQSAPIAAGEVKLFVNRGDLDGAGENGSTELPYWMQGSGGKPVAFIIQVIMKAMVHPYRKQELIRTDAFRAPLASAFKLHLEDILSFHDKESGLSMDNFCLRTDGLSPRYKPSSILPDYGCLVLSPANLWKRDPTRFQMDPSIVSTVFNYQRSHEGHSSLSDLVFGMRQRDTGMTKYPIRNRQRVITYAATIALKKYDPKFIEGLRKHLKSIYPLPTGNATEPEDQTVYMYFPSRSYFYELVPFLFTLLMVFLYVYYCCKKIDLVYSKAGIALCSVATVLASILMSLGLSGLTLNMSSKMCVVPYLVTFISLENLMVITRSVVSTQAHLDVKIRVAQGLSREGWNITKNLFSEITILTLGFFIGILDPSIQDFCLLSVMGLLADFYLQTFFFTTVLSIDMNRNSLSDVPHKSMYKKRNIFQHPISGPGIKKTSIIDRQTSVMAPQCSEFVKQKESKRVKFVDFWAKRRLVQRLFVLCMIVWISTFVYQSSLLETLFRANQAPFLVDQHLQNKDSTSPAPSKDEDNKTFFNLSALVATPTDPDPSSKNLQTGYKKLMHFSPSPWQRLPHTHWPMLFDLYNMTLYGGYISMLPPVHLSMVINPESAKQLRHPKEDQKAMEELDVHSVEGLKTALELEDEEDKEDEELDEEEIGDRGPAYPFAELHPFVPTSPGELFLAFIFVFPSVLFLLYLLYVFYRCMCSRNYAEWRASWDGPESKNTDVYTQVVQESVPLMVRGHESEIDGLVTNDIGNLVVSLCLEGKIVSWDSYSGDRIATIDRRQRYLASRQRKDSENLFEKRSSIEGHRSSNRNSGEFEWREIDKLVPNSPTLKIKSNFSSQKPQTITPGMAYDFGQNVTRSMESVTSVGECVEENGTLAPPVWAIDCNDKYIFVGCASGAMEIWDARTGTFMCGYDDGSGVGITHIKHWHNRVILARLVGTVDFMEVATSTEKGFLRTVSTDVMQDKIAKGHSRNLSNISNISLEEFTPSPPVNLHWLHTVRAHQQPVSCLEVGGGQVLTGSMDHTLKVFRLEDHFNIFTLHGHCGPITTAFIDQLTPNCAGSASQDGMICVWDLLTGACLYSILAHDGTVLSLTYSPGYVISMGQDKKICVWERSQGYLINTIPTSIETPCHDIVMLTHNLMVTSDESSLIVWDARLPEPVKSIRLGDSGGGNNVRILRQLGDTIVCNYSSELRLVHFPLITDKKD